MRSSVRTYEVDGVTLREVPIVLPRGRWLVLVSEREWAPALLLHVAFVRHFEGTLEARA